MGWSATLKGLSDGENGLRGVAIDRRLSARGEKCLSGVKSASASRHAGARAPAGFEGIQGALGGSGCPLTASVTRTNFSGLPKCLQSSKNDAPYIVTYSPHCPCDAPCPHPALSFSGSARKIPCFLCVFAPSATRNGRKRAFSGHKFGRNVDEMWTKC
jgi:hypothetical protein